MDRAEKRRRAWDSVHGRPRGGAKEARPFLGVRFDCCGVYARVYRSDEAKIYEGRCPRCLRKLRIRVGAEGTSARFFRAW